MMYIKVLAIMATVLAISFHDLPDQQRLSTKSCVFVAGSESIHLDSSEYSLEVQQIDIFLCVLNKDKKRKIYLLKNPDIHFFMANKPVLGKPVFILSSASPTTGDYLFPVNEQGIIYDQKECVLLRKIPR